MLLQQGTITAADIPNPHQGKEACHSCHKKPGKLSRRERRKANRLCMDCHAAVSEHDYIHPSNVAPSPEISRSMNRKFREYIKADGGKIRCTVCHDMRIQCLDERKSERGLNPHYLRGGPYDGRSDMCYSCHERQAYQRLNPHRQLDKQGRRMKDKCALCHADTDKLDTATSIADVDFIVKGDLSKMCTGCHIWNPHPGGSFNFSFSGKQEKGPNHLVVPPERIRRTIERMSQQTGITMPLAPENGQVFCGTCHNPHQKGVIKVAESAHGADEKYRLRKQNICGQCHDF